MSTFSVAVSSRPQVRLYGISIRTNMADAFKDCPNLWENVFSKRMHEISGKKPGEYGPCYGISIMLDEQNFEYWAAMEPKEGITLPEGMGEVTLPAGLYAGCFVPDMSQLEQAYGYLYGAWPNSATGYAPDMQAPGFEYYDERFLASGGFEIGMPVIKI